MFSIYPPGTGCLVELNLSYNVFLGNVYATVHFTRTKHICFQLFGPSLFYSDNLQTYSPHYSLGVSIPHARTMSMQLGPIVPCYKGLIPDKCARYYSVYVL